jgi:hypothetical protein
LLLRYGTSAYSPGGPRLTQRFAADLTAQKAAGRARWSASGSPACNDPTVLSGSVEVDEIRPSVTVSTVRADPPRRRVVLTGVLALLLSAGLTSCSRADDVSQPAAAPTADQLAVDRAAIAAQQLQADAVTLAAQNHGLATLLTRIGAVHAAHLSALGGPVPAAVSPSAGSPSAGSSSAGSSAVGTAAVGSSAAGSTAALTPADLVDAEWSAARTALRDGEAAAPALAVLLCRIAAALAANADLLNTALHAKPFQALTPIPVPGADDAQATADPTEPNATLSAEPTDPSNPADAAASTDVADPTAAAGSSETTSSPQVSLGEAQTPVLIALNRLLAGEHAAVYAYPLVIARGARNRRTLAAQLWQAHRTERDELQVTLTAAAVQPVAAQPGYEVGSVPTTSSRAAALALRIERGLAALATDVIAASTAPTTAGTPDPYRAVGADQLVLSARRAVGWSARPTAFPGQAAAPASTPTPTGPTPTSTP